MARGAGDRAARTAGLVVWVDEAQTLDGSCKALVSIHKGGLGVPALIVLSGLPTTARNVRSIPGLSRLADAAVVDMGVMADGECAASTSMMLDTFGTNAPSATRDHAAASVAAMAFGWPQHLKGAQKALASALIAARGDLERIDMAAVGHTAAARRADYYRQRLNTGVMADARALALRIIHKVGAEHMDVDLRSMVDLVWAEAKLFGSPGGTRKAAETFLGDMVRHGVLIRRPSPATVLLDRWTVAVPSMAAWAADQVAAAGGATPA